MRSHHPPWVAMAAQAIHLVLRRCAQNPSRPAAHTKLLLPPHCIVRVPTMCHLRKLSTVHASTNPCMQVSMLLCLTMHRQLTGTCASVCLCSCAETWVAILDFESPSPSPRGLPQKPRVNQVVVSSAQLLDLGKRDGREAGKLQVRTGEGAGGCSRLLGLRRGRKALMTGSVICWAAAGLIRPRCGWYSRVNNWAGMSLACAYHVGMHGTHVMCHVMAAHMFFWGWWMNEWKYWELLTSSEGLGAPWRDPCADTGAPALLHGLSTLHSCCSAFAHSCCTACVASEATAACTAGANACGRSWCSAWRRVERIGAHGVGLPCQWSEVSRCVLALKCLGVHPVWTGVPVI